MLISASSVKGSAGSEGIRAHARSPRLFAAESSTGRGRCTGRAACSTRRTNRDRTTLQSPPAGESGCAGRREMRDTS